MRLLMWLRKRFAGRDRGAEIREELEFHLAARAEQEGSEAARKRFGSPLAAHESTREVWRSAWRDDLGRDAAYALRGFRRSPGFFLAATATLAIGIGAATAIFSVVDPILFRPLPYPQSERLISLGMDAPFLAPFDWYFWGGYKGIRDANLGLASIASWIGVQECDLGGSEPLRIRCASVESRFLPTLKIAPRLGRNFTAAEDLPAANHVALISDALWRGRFGAKPSAVGEQIVIDGTPFEVIGVLPASMELPNLDPFDVVVPQAMPPVGGNNRIVRVIGRLAEGGSVEQTTAALSPSYNAFLATVPADVVKTLNARLRVQTLKDQQGRESRAASQALLAGVLCLLLIAFSNVANLFLARAAARERDTALRAALGASKARLAFGRLAEGLMLTTAGGAAGIALAAVLIRLSQSLAPAALVRLQQASINGRALLAALAMTLAGGVVFALLPTARSQVQGVRATRRNILRPALLVSQIAASCVLVATAGLLLRTVWNLSTVKTGMRPESVTTATFVLSPRDYRDNQVLLAFFERLEAELQALPQFTDFAITDTLPPAGDPRSRPYAGLADPGGVPAQPGIGGLVFWRYVTPRYLSTLGIPILAGRSFRESDRSEGPNSIIINQTLARRLYGQQTAIGRMISLGEGPPITIVGVAADVKNSGLNAPVTPEMYFVRQHSTVGVFRNQRQFVGWRKATVLVRSSADPRYTVEALRKLLARLEPQLPVDFRPLQAEVDQLLERPRFSAALIAFFAFIAPMLAGLGLYSVLAFLVTQRTREIGVRMALGARASNVRWQVLRQASSWVAVGVVAGLAATLGLSRFLSSLLFGVEPNDPTALAASAAALLAAGALAAWIPSYRASRIDPAIALRAE